MLNERKLKVFKLTWLNLTHDKQTTLGICCINVYTTNQRRLTNDKKIHCEFYDNFEGRETMIFIKTTLTLKKQIHRRSYDT